MINKPYEYRFGAGLWTTMNHTVYNGLVKVVGTTDTVVDPETQAAIKWILAMQQEYKYNANQRRDADRIASSDADHNAGN